MSVSEARGTDSDTKVDVQIINHGNVDTSKLPTPKGAQPFYSIPTVTSYLTSAPATETAAAVRELLSADGWEPYGVAGDSQFFKQNAVQLTATVATAPAQQGKTMISYSMSMLSLEIPLPPGADRAQYTDSPPQLSFDVKQSMEDVTGFYRQSLRNHGWKATTDELIKIGFRYFVIFRNAQKDLLELRLSTFEDKTRGLVQFSTAAEVAVREKKAEAELERKNAEANKPKPKLSVRLPLTAMHVQAEPNEIEFTVRAGIAKATAEDLQKQLHTAGWKTEDAMLEGMFGTVSLRNGRQSVSLTYVDSGVLPAEVTISSIDVALEVAKE